MVQGFVVLHGCGLVHAIGMHFKSDNAKVVISLDTDPQLEVLDLSSACDDGAREYHPTSLYSYPTHPASIMLCCCFMLAEQGQQRHDRV